MKLKQILLPTLSLFLICAFVSGALALTYQVTKPVIDKALAEQMFEMQSGVFPSAAVFEPRDIPDGAQYIQSVLAAVSGDGDFLGFIINAAVQGYGGKMEVMTAIDIDGKIISVQLISESETKGLGKEVREPYFADQFLITPEQYFSVVKHAKSSEHEILAVSNATISSRAVTNAVNASYDCYKLMEGKN